MQAATVNREQGPGTGAPPAPPSRRDHQLGGKQEQKQELAVTSDLSECYI